MAEEYTAEIGRALDWDLAYYGWSPREDASVEIIEGHTAGKAHHGGRTKHPTRFERKWLQLRQNALRRGRVLDEGVANDVDKTRRGQPVHRLAKVQRWSRNSRLVPPKSVSKTDVLSKTSGCISTFDR